MADNKKSKSDSGTGHQNGKNNDGKTWERGTFCETRGQVVAKQGARSRIENIADEFDIVLFSGLVMCASPVSDS